MNLEDYHFVLTLSRKFERVLNSPQAVFASLFDYQINLSIFQYNSCVQLWTQLAAHECFLQNKNFARGPPLPLHEKI